MNRQQFIDHATKAINGADELLKSHTATRRSCHQCSQLAPCDVYESARLVKAHFVRQLARINRTN